MKKVLLNTKIGALAIAVLLATSVNTKALANDGQPDQLKYLGNINNSPVYQLSLQNADNNIYIISVRDYEGTVLFREKLQGSKIIRNYQLADLPAESYHVSFEITNLKGDVVDLYNVNKTNKVLEAVVVNKVK